MTNSSTADRSLVPAGLPIAQRGYLRRLLGCASARSLPGRPPGLPVQTKTRQHATAGSNTTLLRRARVSPAPVRSGSAGAALSL